ncbi:hypothetical protein [Rhodococcus sp. MEB064]|uniref:hypothetical protein n=1 Tax=Rhodococcus sp. MEB064 TaxID=1587522 RepID=UPI0012E01E42|nr:hypothetical protein [Rhodococcus sp. MEB064]
MVRVPGVGPDVHGGVEVDADAMTAPAGGLDDASTALREASTAVSVGETAAFGVVGSDFAAVLGAASQRYSDALSTLSDRFAATADDVLRASRSYRVGDESLSDSLSGGVTR